MYSQKELEELKRTTKVLLTQKSEGQAALVLDRYFNQNKRTTEFVFKPGKKEGTLTLVNLKGRPPTRFGRLQKAHTFAMSATFHAVCSIVSDMTLKEAIKKLGGFHDVFFVLYQGSYFTEQTRLINTAHELFDLVLEVQSHPEIQKVYVLEYLTLVSYLLNFAEEAVAEVDYTPQERGEEGQRIRKALEQLKEMDQNPTLIDLEVMKKLLTDLIDSTAILEGIITSKPNEELNDITWSGAPFVFRQVLLLDLLLQSLPNLYYAWLGPTGSLLGQEGFLRIGELDRIIFGSMFSTIGIRIDRKKCINEALLSIRDCLSWLRAIDKRFVSSATKVDVRGSSTPLRHK